MQQPSPSGDDGSGLEPVSRLETAAASLRLAALAFLHPTDEFHALLRSGEFEGRLAELGAHGWSLPCAVVAPQLDRADHEAQFIALYHTAIEGIVGLHAGDYPQLLDGRARSEVLLEQIRWHKHFGLTAHQGRRTSVLPDHLACQLEFLATLLELEHRAGPRAQGLGYPAAGRDFLAHHLLPLLNQIRSSLGARTGALAACHLSLAGWLLSAGESMLAGPERSAVPPEPYHQHR